MIDNGAAGVDVPSTLTDELAVVAKPRRRRKKADPPGREAQRVRPKEQGLIQFRRASLFDALAVRESFFKSGKSDASAVARRDLERYYALIGNALRDVRLTVEDLRRLERMMRGADLQTVAGVQKLPGMVAAYVGAHDALSVKMRGLDVVDLFAVVDAVERWKIKQRA